MINGHAPIDLWMCASSGDVVGLERLLEMGADPSEENELGKTPFLAACIYGHLECARVLMPVSDPDHLANGGLDGLMIAATFGHTHMLDDLSVWCKKKREDENGWDAARRYANFETADAIGQALAIQMEKMAFGTVAKSPEGALKKTNRM